MFILVLAAAVGLAACGPVEPADQLERDINDVLEIIPRQVRGPLELEPVPGETERFSVFLPVDMHVLQTGDGDIPEISVDSIRATVWRRTGHYMSLLDTRELNPRINTITFYWYDAETGDRPITIEISSATRDEHRWGHLTDFGWQPTPIWQELHEIADRYEDELH